jgi:hypothetical protein
MELQHLCDKLKIPYFLFYDEGSRLHKTSVYKFSKNLGASSKL